MPKTFKPRSGSLQYWPRKRVRKFLPSVNWQALGGEGVLGFIGYKVGMISYLVKDNTEHSKTKGQRIVIPATILEIPSMKIFSIRFYKNNKVVKEILNENLDKELKKKLKLPKQSKKPELEGGNYGDIRVIVYSQVKNTGIKKTPDIIEVGIGGNKEEKLEFVKKNLNKEILAEEILKPMQLVDVRGLSKGKGTQGPVKRFGVSLRSHKSEKGRRGPGSIGPWHPARVTFRVPMAGQLGMFTRLCLNKNILDIGKVEEKNINPKSGFLNYGNIKTSYIILQGSVQGARKRQLLLTLPLRPTKKQEKKNYELIKIL